MRKRWLAMCLCIALVASLFAGCGKDETTSSTTDSTTTTKTNSNQAATTDKKEIKEFTAFFDREGAELNEDNVIQQIIADKIGAKVKETWLTGQTAEEAVPL